MAITDYIPNIFGQAPGTYQGLLGAGLIKPEQLQQTQSRANIQGLLGAGLALAQGMSRIGPRRSAAENILAALSGGMAAGGGAFDQSLKNIAMQQQLQSAALTQKQALDRQTAIAEAGKEDPALARLLLIDPAEGAKQLALRQQIKALQRPQVSGQAPVPQIAPPQPVTESPTQPVQQQSLLGVPAFGGQSFMTQPMQQPVEEKSLDTLTFIEPNRMDRLLAQREEVAKDIEFLRQPERAVIPAAKDALIAANNEYERLTKQISFESTGNRVDDIRKMRAASPVIFKNDFDFLEAAAADKTITPEQLSTRVSELNKRIQDYNKDEKSYERSMNDFTKEAVRVGRKVAPGKDPKDYTDADFAAIHRQLQAEAKDRAAAGRTTINLADPARQAQALSENSSKYVQNKNVSESFEVATRFNNFVQAYNNPEAGGASDAVLIYSMAKMLDPGGAVQQGDIGTIAGQKSIPERLQSIHQQFLNTRSLSNEQRDNLNAMAYSLMNVKRKALEPVIKQYRNYATALQSPDPTADIQDPFTNIQLPKQRIVTINQKRVTVRLGNDGNYYYTDPKGKNYIYND